MAIGDARLEVRTIEDFRIGRVVSRTFDALFANPVTFLVLSALLSVPSLLFSYYTVNVLMGASGTARVWVPILGGFLSMTFGSLVQAGLTQGTLSWLNGEKSDFGQLLAVMMRNVVPLTVISVLAFLGVVLSTLLLIIPGIIVMMMWLVVIPVRVVESTGITESFGRSRALTREYRWRILLLFLGYFILAMALSLVAHLPLGVGLVPKPGDFTITYAAVDLVLRTILAGVTAVGTASIYYELRLVKEGIGAQQMAAAFD